MKEVEKNKSIIEFKNHRGSKLDNAEKKTLLALFTQAFRFTYDI